MPRGKGEKGSLSYPITVKGNLVVKDGLDLPNIIMFEIFYVEGSSAKEQEEEEELDNEVDDDFPTLNQSGFHEEREKWLTKRLVRSTNLKFWVVKFYNYETNQFVVFKSLVDIVGSQNIILQDKWSIFINQYQYNNNGSRWKKFDFSLFTNNEFFRKNHLREIGFWQESMSCFFPVPFPLKYSITQYNAINLPGSLCISHGYLVYQTCVEARYQNNPQSYDPSDHINGRKKVKRLPVTSVYSDRDFTDEQLKIREKVELLKSTLDLFENQISETHHQKKKHKKKRQEIQEICEDDIILNNLPDDLEPIEPIDQDSQSEPNFMVNQEQNSLNLLNKKRLELIRLETLEVCKQSKIPWKCPRESYLTIMEDCKAWNLYGNILGSVPEMYDMILSIGEVNDNECTIQVATQEDFRTIKTKISLNTEDAVPWKILFAYDLYAFAYQKPRDHWLAWLTSVASINDDTRMLNAWYNFQNKRDLMSPDEIAKEETQYFDAYRERTISFDKISNLKELFISNQEPPIVDKKMLKERDFIPGLYINPELTCNWLSINTVCGLAERFLTEREKVFTHLPQMPMSSMLQFWIEWKVFLAGISKKPIFFHPTFIIVSCIIFTIRSNLDGNPGKWQLFKNGLKKAEVSVSIPPAQVGKLLIVDDTQMSFFLRYQYEFGMK